LTVASNLRALRRRIRSTKSTKKIFSAQELIAGARIVRAQARVEASKPYAREITRVLSALASSASLDHPLLTERQNPRRAAVLVITSDRGFAGSYNVNVLRRTEELLALLRKEGKEPVLYVVGRKGETYYSFRDRPMAETFTGFSEQPHYENAQEVGSVLIDVFTAGEDDADGGAGADGVLGVDELHIVYTEFRSLLSQVPVAKRMAPLEVEEVEEFDYEREDREHGQAAGDSGVPTSYEFEPSAEGLLDALLPKYVTTRIYAAMPEALAAASSGD
jgi:F-type H+-transporting ATPase subunit gamma